MEIYLNLIKSNLDVTTNIKDLIPCMNTRRRMGTLLKESVATGVEAINEFEQFGTIDAIITASWLGCINDSEKFLRSMILNNEEQLNPTPFIQSTFNTVGAQIALIKGLNCYNITYTHGSDSLKCALLDAYVKLQIGACNNILVGIFDETTPSLDIILKRLHFVDYKMHKKFYILSNTKVSNCKYSFTSFDSLVKFIKEL